MLIEFGGQQLSEGSIVMSSSTEVFVCPPSHGHTTNCYRRHGCRCAGCKAKCAASQRAYLEKYPAQRRSGTRACKCGCGQRVTGVWADGHRPAPKPRFSISPAGMTLARAIEIANGGTPRLRDVA